MNFLFYFNSALLGVGLAMDAFSVSLANGLSDVCMRRRKMVTIAGVFSIMQAIMPIIGWFFVHHLAEAFTVLEGIIPWVALCLLSFIGGKMLFEGIEEIKGHKTMEAESCVPKRLSFAAILIQGVATSIDALSVGLTICDYSFVEAMVCALIIALVTFVICLFGVMIGKRFGMALAGKSSVFGGVILILIGIEIFVTSFI